jgi:lipoprotein-anchoring transpeptidase ErfK/SrfK
MHGRPRCRSARLAAGALAAAALLAACARGGSGDEVLTATTAHAPSMSGASTTESGTTATTPASATHVSYVAEATVDRVDVYAAADGGDPTQTLDNPTENGGPLVFLVKGMYDSGADRYEVYLPVRPNGSSGWVPADQVRITQHEYWIEVFIGEHRIVVHRAGDVVYEGPIAVGKASTPTPGGVFYLKELLKPPNPNSVYGPYAYGLSGFSNVLTEFNGGDGVIGIHGTNDESVLGTDVSHGCIRMGNAAITMLAGILPLGAPVSIIA